MTATTDIVITIPKNADVPYPVGTELQFEFNGTAPTMTLAKAATVTINSRGGALAAAGRYGVVAVKKVATNTWTALGDLQ